jgi:hemolysin III
MVSSTRRSVEGTWNYDRVELIADGIVHAIGVSLGLAGAIAIVAVAANSQRTTELSSIAVYSVGLLSMLSFSAAYNTWPVSPAKWVLRRFDHSAIFLMIAGTYTPFIAQMKGNLVATGFLAAVWLTAVVGIILKLLLPRRFDRLAVVLYLLLGWSGAIVYEPIVVALPSLDIWLLAAGGALYCMGLVFYAWRSLRFQNAIWHAFVLVAACCHYAAVLFCVAYGWT